MTPSTVIFAALSAALLILLTAALAALKRKTERINKIVKLYDIGKKITSNIKIKSLMREIMEIAKEEAGAESCSLYIVDEEAGELWFEVALGEKGDRIKEMRFKIGQGIVGWVAEHGTTLNLEDVNKDHRYNREVAEKLGLKQKAMLTMPVVFQDRIIGVLQLINKKGGGVFSKEDEELMGAMSSQIAIALENARLYKDMRDMFVDSIQSLASAIDAKDPYTNGHSTRVTEYSLMMAGEMGLKEEEIERLEYMAVLHDVGKIGIKDSILNKQAKLDDDEFVIMKSHTVIGARIMEQMKSLRALVAGAKYHHEKFDGSGYYEGLKGLEIPLEARIIAVADTYDAMTTDRPYRKGLDHETAMQEINRFSGRQFDPEVVESFNKVMRDRIENSAS